MKYRLELDIEFKKNPYEGKLIVLEGNEGTGKTTQVARIVEELNRRGYKAVATKEPTKSPIGQFIRERVLSGEITIPRVAIQYLYCADRAVHQEEIVSKLKNGYIVVCDRYFWSAVAYGMADLEGDIDQYLVSFSILSAYNQFIKPDMSFYLNLPMDKALLRIEKSHKHKEIYDNAKMFSKIEKGYKYLLDKFPQEFVKIDAGNSVEEVTREIIGEIKKRF
ncbi:dTMP kinase [Patescibacteria group bacterium]|nr:dTMP kinase [Patescibacteria group bacterium]